MQPAIVSDFKAFLERQPLPALSRLEKQRLLDFQTEIDLESGRPSLDSMKGAWNKLSASYDAVPTLDQRLHVFEKLFLSLAFHGNEDLLSIGCGSGFYEVFLAKHLNPRGKTLCLDFSRPFLEQALALAQREGVAYKMEFLERPASRTGLPDHSVDKILCLHSLEYMPDWEAALREFHRVLRGDALARLAVFCNEFPPTGFSFKAFLVECERLGFKALESSAVTASNFLGGQGEIAFLLFKPA
ncbi:MAG TPA: class I SAM-dependent methyltransferase [Candidatus Diapherotrites archaeon]|uniref:Class I SAM-dependent methyltransferase n=1 Tax=Candidatus Iainarchaeum sp. TaxID=3101447 RepID=A0A7J4JID3_9ARCH|nr:class I SAM-dependent methyltransferase [Candidatus Diapherotrites archaeon]HIH17104.1 class I SAM-dependent methyltransferase [Candidatus Diapherotrites archaeon]